MGLSFISTDQACQRAESEIPRPDADFDTLVTSAQNVWREKLTPIVIETGDMEDNI